MRNRPQTLSGKRLGVCAFRIAGGRPMPSNKESAEQDQAIWQQHLLSDKLLHLRQISAERSTTCLSVIGSDVLQLRRPSLPKMRPLPSIPKSSSRSQICQTTAMVNNPKERNLASCSMVQLKDYGRLHKNL